MTAIQAIDSEIIKIQYAMQQCVSESGYVFSHSKYKYNMLVRRLKEFKESKDWLVQQGIGVIYQPDRA